MSVAIDDDKHHLNHKKPSDNLYLTILMCDNRVGLVNHAISFS